MAQNSGDGSVENFTLSATVLMRFFANPVLVIISAVILAGIIVMVVLIVAKNVKIIKFKIYAYLNRYA